MVDFVWLLRKEKGQAVEELNRRAKETAMSGLLEVVVVRRVWWPLGSTNNDGGQALSPYISDAKCT